MVIQTFTSLIGQAQIERNENRPVRSIYW